LTCFSSWHPQRKGRTLRKGKQSPATCLGRSLAKYGAVNVDTLQAICDNGRCDSMRNGLPLDKDADHTTATTAQSMSYLYTTVFKALALARAVAPH
jgi:hypothetical protein